MKKASGGKKSGSPAGSGKDVAQVGVAQVGKSAENLKRNVGAPTNAVLPPVDPAGEIFAPVLSALTKLGSPENEITPEQLSFPVYGNYCGFGHGDPTGKTPPMDAVDAVCREHDLCYGRLGDFDRRCDRDLIARMPSAVARTPSPLGKNAGLLALLYFSVAERNLALGKTLLKRT
jgi:hypothetical protein